MIVNYFRRIKDDHIPGFIYIRRNILNPVPTMDDWFRNSKLVVPVTFQSGGIEDADGSLQADFANMFIGGGVLSGTRSDGSERYSL
jgi:hypothetical protein